MDGAISPSSRICCSKNRENNGSLFPNIFHNFVNLSKVHNIDRILVDEDTKKVQINIVKFWPNIGIL